MSKGEANLAARAASLVVDAKLTAYQLTLAGLRLPLWIHILFNAACAAGMVLLGHPALGAALFVASTGIDAVKQVLVGRWIAEAGAVEEGRGMRRLGVLCAVRVACYTTPTFIMALGGGLAELTFYGVQLAGLLAVALGAGALSRTVFWSLTLPQMLQVATLAVLLFPPLVSGAVFIGLAILLVILAMVSESTVRAISRWHEAFLDNIALVEDLGAARDQAVAERTAADAARETARQANRAKSNFLATMSHEIRTPMNGVLGMAQILKRDEADPVQAQRLDVLIDSGEYLLSILNDILDVSKIDAGKLEIVSAPEDLRPLLERMVGFWAARAEEKGVQLGLELGLDLPDRVMVDALRLRQVLFNLIGNALKFTEAGAVVVLADAVHDGDGVCRVRLSVRDTGPGIAPQHLTTLFDRFSQVDDTEMRRFGGTGLGLAIVRQLSELMHGRVWVDSVLGEGSTFHVELPLTAVHAPAHAALSDGQDPAETCDTLRVLAVDDNAVNLLVLEQLLTSLGHEVARAQSGAAALDALSSEPFDLVLTDIQMPEMTGTEVLERLRAQPGPNQAVPVIALTADVTSGGRQRYLDQGFTEHAAKPIQLHDLLVAMARAMDATPAAGVRAA